MRLHTLSLWFAASLVGCHPRPGHMVTYATVSSGAESQSIRIATFNLQNCGPTKVSRPHDLAVYVSAIRRYEIVAIQEIQDAAGEAARTLLAALNDVDGPDYDMLLSDNSGRESDDRSSQERYAYFFNTEVVRALNDGVLFDDSEHDRFQREPFVGRFAVGDWDFSLVEVHTRPQAAVAEIGALHEVVTWARVAYRDDDVIMVGDFNASCDYASPKKLDALDLRGGQYLWIVPDAADTNVSPRACAYDRIVATTSAGMHFTGKWGVDRETGSVSDHHPVWAAFKVSR